MDSLLSEPPGKPKNTGVISLSLLQGNFPTQELNWILLNCRQILYWLNYQDVTLDGAKTQTKKFRRSLKEQVPDFLFQLENGGPGLILPSYLLKGSGETTASL